MSTKSPILDVAPLAAVCYPTFVSSVAGLFRLEGRVDRRTYLGAGLALMVLKYLLDATLVFAASGEVLMPQDFLSPLIATRQRLLGSGDELHLIAMWLWSMVFLWIGVVMSVRRAEDAGFSPAVGLTFVLPVVNLVLMGTLAVVPSREAPPSKPDLGSPSVRGGRVRAALLGVFGGAAVAAAMVAVAGAALGDYGWSLFVATPFAMGAVSSAAFNRPAVQGLGATLAVAALSLLVAGAALIAFALEGALCLLMVAPLAAVTSMLGAVIVRALVLRRRPPSLSALSALILCTPLSALAARASPEPVGAREVMTAIEIDAPPDRVWPHVIGFSELPPPSPLVFRLGIAYPVRARIDGEGVGAVRHCEFSTGAFVEPIAVWDPPRQLAFDVAAQPPPMTEQSPYRELHPPHLDGYFRSLRGEFRLEALPGGRTRLEGRTWYALDFAPVAYWALWSDALVHGIHEQVLLHIRGLSERDR